jgi:hypothetical protein
MDKVDEKVINELHQNVDKFADKIISDDFKVDKEQSVKLNKFFESFVDIINKNKNLLPEKAKKIFNNIILNLDKIENKKFSDNTIEELKTYLIKHDYESIGNLLEKDFSLLGGKRNKTRRNKSKRNKSKRNKSKRNKSKRNKSRRNKSRRNKNSKYNKLKGGMVNDDEVERVNPCSICDDELDDNTRGQSITLHLSHGIPHNYHFNCIKTWILNRINTDRANITCPLCAAIFNFNQLPVQLQQDPDIQQAYNAFLANPQQVQALQQANAQQQQQQQQQLLWQQAQAAQAAQRERERVWGPIVMMLFVALIAWSINYLLNSIPRLSELTPEEREQMEEFLTQLNNTFTEFFNNNQM